MTISKFIFKNFISNINNYLIYFLSSIVSVSIFFLFISIKDILRKSLDRGNINSLILGVMILVAVISCIFTRYAFKVYIKTRYKDYGMLVLLGMNKRFIYLFVLIECTSISLISTIIGIFIGNISLSLLFKILQIFGAVSDYIYYNPLNNCLIVFILFIFIFVISIGSILYKLKNSSILNFFNYSVTEEYKNNKYWFLGFIGIILVIGAISILFYNIKNYLLHAINSMIICILGIRIIILFWGDIALKLLKSNKKLYYKKLLSYNNLYYRFNKNRDIIFISFLINFLMLIILGGLFSDYIGKNLSDFYNEEYPYDVVYVSNTEIKTDIIEYEFKELDLYTNIKYKFITMPVYGTYNEERRYWEDHIDYLYQVISITDFNYLSNSNKVLNNGEILLVEQTQTLDHLDFNLSDYPNMYIKLGSNLEKYKIKEIFSKILIGRRRIEKCSHLIVASDEDYKSIMDNNQVPNEIIIYNFSNKDSNKLKLLSKSLARFEANHNNISVYDKDMIISNEKNEDLFLNLIFLFLGLLLSLCLGCIIYFKISSEFTLILDKYMFLFKLGMDKKHIKMTLGEEIGVNFIIPIFISAILSYPYYLIVMGFYINFAIDVKTVDFIICNLCFIIVLIICVLLQLLYYKFLKCKLIKSVMSNCDR